MTKRKGVKKSTIHLKEDEAFGLVHTRAWLRKLNCSCQDAFDHDKGQKNLQLRGTGFLEFSPLPDFQAEKTAYNPVTSLAVMVFSVPILSSKWTEGGEKREKKGGRKGVRKHTRKTLILALL